MPWTYNYHDHYYAGSVSQPGEPAVFVYYPTNMQAGRVLARRITTLLNRDATFERVDALVARLASLLEQDDQAHG